MPETMINTIVVKLNGQIVHIKTVIKSRVFKKNAYLCIVFINIRIVSTRETNKQS